MEIEIEILLLKTRKIRILQRTCYMNILDVFTSDKFFVTKNIGRSWNR